MPRKMLSVPRVATIAGTRRTVDDEPVDHPEDEPERDPEQDRARGLEQRGVSSDTATQ